MKHELEGRMVTIRNSGSTKQWSVLAVVHKNGIDVAHIRFMDDVHMEPVARLEPVPRAPSSIPSGYLSMDSFSVTSDEATEWFAFLMLQAGTMFMNVPDDEDEAKLPGYDPVRAEILRIITARGEPADGAIGAPAMAFYDAAKAYHDRLKENLDSWKEDDGDD